MSLFLGYSSGFLQVYHLPTSTSRYFKLFPRLRVFIYYIVFTVTYKEQKVNIPPRFKYALEDAAFSPFRRGDAQLRAQPSGGSRCHIRVMIAFRTVTVTDDSSRKLRIGLIASGFSYAPADLEALNMEKGI